MRHSVDKYHKFYEMLLLTGVTQIAAALTTLNTTLGDVKVKANILSSNLSTLKNDTDAILPSTGCSVAGNCPSTTGVAMGFDSNDVSFSSSFQEIE